MTSPLNGNTEKLILTLASVLLFIFLVPLTRKQASYWRDSITLFQHAVNVTANNDIAYSNLGVALAENNRSTKRSLIFRRPER